VEGEFYELRLNGVLRTSPVERACALFGKDHVWAFADEIKRARQDLMIFRTYHPSPRLMNTRPKCRKDFEETYQEIKNFLMVRH
jgi:uracil-DNA glycosylase